MNEENIIFFVEEVLSTSMSKSFHISSNQAEKSLNNASAQFPSELNVESKDE